MSESDKYDDEVQAEYAEYMDDAERGISDDWALYDAEKSNDALFRVWKTLNATPSELGLLVGMEHFSDTERIAQAKEIMREVMESAARSHAETVVTNRNR